MHLIVELKLGKVAKRLEENQQIKVEFTNQVLDQIVSSCTRAETGARNIDAIIDRTIIPEVSAKLLGFMADGKSPSSLKVGVDKKGKYNYKFEVPKT